MVFFLASKQILSFTSRSYKKALHYCNSSSKCYGVLHMGHMLNNTIQDVLIRRARMQGYNACWVPIDHAAIATEAKSSTKTS